MTLAAELVGAFLGGIVSTLSGIRLFGPRFVRWYMKRAFGGMLYSSAAYKIQTEEPLDALVTNARKSRQARLDKQ